MTGEKIQHLNYDHCPRPSLLYFVQLCWHPWTVKGPQDPSGGWRGMTKRRGQHQGGLKRGCRAHAPQLGSLAALHSCRAPGFLCTSRLAGPCLVRKDGNTLKDHAPCSWDPPSDLILVLSIVFQSKCCRTFISILYKGGGGALG